MSKVRVLLLEALIGPQTPADAELWEKSRALFRWAAALAVLCVALVLAQ